jgi:tRNA A-37 threonylcarbamoyl transferase component Bud32
MLVGKEIGPFYVERELGSGAMGTVFRAVHRGSGQRVALKMISDILLGNETAVKRFEREARILKQLKHPNIVGLIGTGRYKKTPFFIMEYVEGESLDVILERRSSLARESLRERDGRFSWEEVVPLGQQLCEALKHAHQRGIIHRDLKPSNLMILRDGTLKLTDFGIAKDMDVTALTGANVTVGTAAYMSPEQCKGEKTISHKSDLYSLGVVFYELLTGRKPFIKESAVEMFLAHVNDIPERPSRHVMDIPVWLDTLVIQLMEKKPEHRPFDAAMVRKVLDEVETKLLELRSAGVDAATARSVDRVPNPTPADEADREAARALRGAVAKKKIRKKGVPLFERRWVQAIGLVGVLGALGGFVYFMTRPPSEEKLYSLVNAAHEAKDLDGIITNSQRYLGLYEGRDEKRTKNVHDWWERAAIDRREQQLHNRLNKGVKYSDDPDGDAIAAEAIKREDEGDMEKARLTWERLAKHYQNAEDSDKGINVLLVEKKKNVLIGLSQTDETLRKRIEHIRIGKQPERNGDELAETQVEEALRYETFGDLPIARELYRSVVEEYKKDLTQRSWVVFAAWRHRIVSANAVSPDKVAAFRKDLLTKKLAEVKSVSASADPFEKRQMEKIARDLVDLYKKDPSAEFQSIAHQAEQKLRELKPS